MIFHFRLKRYFFISYSLLALCFGFLFEITPVSAATIEVTTFVDEDFENSSACSLREALYCARHDIAHSGCTAGSGADIITLPAGTYTLSKVLTPIYTEITIIGEDPTTTIIEASDCNPVSETCTHDYNVFWVESTGNLTVKNVTIRHGNGGNNGGGISNFKGNLTITNSIFTENRGRIGGGILNYYEDSTLTIANSTFVENITSTAEGANGGAIYNQGSLSITNSTLSSNYANTWGGGIYNSGFLTMINSTLSANVADANGGGIYNSGTVSITNSTISGNRGYSGGGIYSRTGATLNFTNTIIANSILDGPGFDCASFGTIGTNISNLVEDGSCVAAISGDPLLGALGDNGGFTHTHALLEGSPAIDTGDQGSCPETDQRGVTRPQGAGCDIGSFELIPEYYIYMPLILK